MAVQATRTRCVTVPSPWRSAATVPLVADRPVIGATCQGLGRPVLGTLSAVAASAWS